MSTWVPSLIPIELLHRLVPAALEQDLLDTHLAQQWRDEARDIAFGWLCWPSDISPLLSDVTDLGVEDWPPIAVAWQSPGASAPVQCGDTEEPCRLTFRQRLALLQALLGATVIEERQEPTQTFRLG